MVFKKNEKIIFWDIGPKVDLFSIYAALKHKDIEVHSFEPSSGNPRVLSRNISINTLKKVIYFFTPDKVRLILFNI